MGTLDRSRVGNVSDSGNEPVSGRRRLASGVGMNEWAGGFPGTLVSDDTAFDVEFEERLRDSRTLAFRVAYGVLRQREDAEDVAQEAFARAFRHFPRLRDRERFRAWLVRTSWRLAIDRWR